MRIQILAKTNLKVVQVLIIQKIETKRVYFTKFLKPLLYWRYFHQLFFYKKYLKKEIIIIKMNQKN